jgi:hypothetical protein
MGSSSGTSKSRNIVNQNGGEEITCELTDVPEWGLSTGPDFDERLGKIGRPLKIGNYTKGLTSFHRRIGNSYMLDLKK